MSSALGNVRGIPPVETPGKFLKSNADFGLEWGDAGTTFTLPPNLASVGPIITDFNAPKANGWYRANSAVNGPPTGSGYGLLMHQEWDGNNGHSHQIYYQMYGTTDIWARACVTYVWQAWFKISPIDDVTLPSRLRAISPSVADCNTAVDNGWYWCAPGATNAPDAAYYAIRVDVLNSPTQVMQTAWRYSTTPTPIYTRVRMDGAWQAWQKIFPIDDSNLPSRLQTTAQATSDWNTATASGFYRGGLAANAPTAGVTYNYFMGYVSTYDAAGGHVAQILVSLFENTMWFRRQASGGWGAWTQVWPVTIDNSNLPPRLYDGAFGNSVSDCNSAVQSGWYNCSPGTANSPNPAAHYHIEVIAGAANYVRQYAHYLYGSAIHMRVIGGGSWSSWGQIYPIIDDGFSLPLRIQTPGQNFIADCNAFMTNGWGYTQAGQSANTPYGATIASGPWGVLEAIFMNGTDNGIQRWWQYGTENRYERSRSNATWGAWFQTWPLPVDANLPPRLKSVSGTVPANDVNQAVESGFYYVATNAANSPTPGQWGALVVANITTLNSLRQIFYEHASLREFQRFDSGGGWSAWVQVGPPGGQEIWYTELTGQVTSSAWVFNGVAVTYDGSPVMMEFNVPYVGNIAGTGQTSFWLYDGGTVLDRVGLVALNGGGAGVSTPLCVKRKLTPSAGTHYYGLYAQSDAGSGMAIIGGPGGGGTTAPGFMRITRA